MLFEICHTHEGSIPACPPRCLPAEDVASKTSAQTLGFHSV